MSCFSVLGAVNMQNLPELVNLLADGKNGKGTLPGASPKPAFAPTQFVGY
jgi:hypothetical protein